MKMRANELFKWMRERQAIYLKREQGLSAPWTRDPILQQYRFCNVYREQDAVTKYVAKHWRMPHREDPELWFAMVVARLFNLPRTLQQVGYPVPYWPMGIYKATEVLQRQDLTVFNGAYIVSTNGHRQDKVQYLVQRVLSPLWNARKRITAEYQRNGQSTLASFHQYLMQFDGLGSFMAAQVVADLKYVAPLRNKPDWNTFAASGPGSRRGLNRVMGHDVASPWNENTWHLNLMTLKTTIDGCVLRANMPPVHAQDLQNCLCEFDKYERARLGEGRPKQKFAGIGA